MVGIESSRLIKEIEGFRELEVVDFFLEPSRNLYILELRVYGGAMGGREGVIDEVVDVIDSYGFQVIDVDYDDINGEYSIAFTL